MRREDQDPRAEYARRLEQRRTAAGRHARMDLALSNSRLVVAILAAILAWLAFGSDAIEPWWLAAPAALFLLLVIFHERVAQAQRRCERAASFYESCIARLDHRWMGKGEPGQRFLDDSHIFAADLDLFGKGSLFELLCTARTRAGEETLAAWLRVPAPPVEVLERQAAVDEVHGRLDLREDLALLGADVRAGVDPEALANWGADAPVLTSRAARLAAAGLAIAAVASLVAWAAGWAGPAPLAAALLVECTFALSLRRRVLRVIGAAETAGRDLALLSQVLERLERERYTTPRLARLRAALDIEGLPPSRRIARLHRLIDLLDARRNQIFAPLSGLLLWATQIAHAIEAWRSVSGPAVLRWLDAVGEFEAFCALAAYAYEHPADPFPQILEPDQAGACLEGEGLGHPLLSEDLCVRNDVRLGAGPRVLIVSGSNMSGKSTLLRSVGTNTVLALAGAPVRARRLRLTPLAVGASIRIQDSLQAGTSRFYAEITRLRQIVDLTKGSMPPLFLIDEMLHGTNSHDRRIGAEAVVRGLVERGAIGLVTTHDLALAHIVDSLAARAANVHFEDHVEDGKITFDYIMRPGVVQKSNALALMRTVGLDI